MPEVIINGTAGRIEGRYHQSGDPKAPVALVLHPHPLHGGSMNNKVTYNLYKTFVDQGFSVLRINFRGVGRSEGRFDGGTGELMDVTSAVNWLHDKNMEAVDFWIAGFSFGAWVALQTVMRRPEISNYILIAPPTNNYDYSFIVPCTSAGLILQGDKDEISKEPESARLAERLAARDGAFISYQVVSGADHFFSNHMPDLASIVDKYIEDRIAVDATKLRKVKRDRRRRKRKNPSEIKPERNHFPVKPLSEFE